MLCCGPVAWVSIPGFGYSPSRLISKRFIRIASCSRLMTYAGGPPAPPPVPCISTGEATFACDCCPAVFESKQQLSVHKFRVHGTRVDAAPYSRGAVCRACLKQFWHPKRLLRHLEYDKPDCLEILVSHGLDSPPQALEADLTGSLRFELPAARLSGPVRPLHSCDVPAALDLAVHWLAASASLDPVAALSHGSSFAAHSHVHLQLLTSCSVLQMRGARVTIKDFNYCTFFSFLHG